MRKEAVRNYCCVRVLVLVSGGGTNLQALLDAEKALTLGTGGIKDFTVVGVIADRQDAPALERARRAKVPTYLELPDRSLPLKKRREELSDRILSHAQSLGADLIVLAGFLSILQGPLLSSFSGRMINLHPALLPKFGGEGMYGDKVHAAVLAAGETESGCTVHLVDEGTDTGRNLLQHRVPVLPGDTVESLAKRIHLQEHKAIVEAVILMASTLCLKGTSNEPA